MAPHVQDHVVDEVKVSDNLSADNNATGRHVFQAIEHIGMRAYNSDSKQRIAAIVIAVLICTAMYGVLYLGMH